jgi:phosphatidylinositol glycan class M
MVQSGDPVTTVAPLMKTTAGAAPESFSMDQVSHSKGAAMAPTTPTQSQRSLISTFFSHPAPLYISATLLRLILLLYGLYQDANTAIKYTDIDYLVFTDAARSVSRSESPYARETYRYTPLLAWLLLPTAWTTSSQLGNAALFAFGKVMFAVADLVAGWLIERVLIAGLGDGKRMDPSRARMFAAIWLLNPMVATISTRGSSEGLLGVLVMALLWAVLSRKVSLAGLLLGFGVHFKIYPFIYAPAIMWWMDDERMKLTSASKNGGKTVAGKPNLLYRVRGFITPARVKLTLVSLVTFLGLNVLMLWL